jgi:hypothetical protein
VDLDRLDQAMADLLLADAEPARAPDAAADTKTESEEVQ